jgi:phospholipid/cholesterol/gamma-HCH transport system substrate-binding protein
MQGNRAIEISTGLFVLLGLAALFFMVTQITNKQLSSGDASYGVQALFENIGSLKVGAPVSMAGVTVGRVEAIQYDQNVYKAVVQLRINSTFNRIPKDSDAAIQTSGLLGGQYIGITAGGAEEFLKEGDRIEFVQDAFVLENLINQLVATFMNRNQQSGSDQAQSETASQEAAK